MRWLKKKEASAAPEPIGITIVHGQSYKVYREYSGHDGMMYLELGLDAKPSVYVGATILWGGKRWVFDCLTFDRGPTIRIRPEAIIDTTVFVDGRLGELQGIRDGKATVHIDTAKFANQVAALIGLNGKIVSVTSTQSDDLRPYLAKIDRWRKHDETVELILVDPDAPEQDTQEGW